MKYIRKHRINLASYLKFKTKNDQVESDKCDEASFKHLQNAPESVQLKAVKCDSRAIKFIHNPSEKVQLEAIKWYVDSFRYIDNPCDQVIDVIEYLYYNERDVFDRNFEIVE